MVDLLLAERRTDRAGLVDAPAPSPARAANPAVP
jgi:hypothetical protein